MVTTFWQDTSSCEQFTPKGELLFMVATRKLTLTLSH